MFRFANPEYFWLMAAIPGMVAVWVWAAWRRGRRMARFGDAARMAALMPEVSTKRQFTKFMLGCAGVALLVVGLARPQTGSKLKEKKVSGIEMMIAVDVSNSMLAQDFEPNRLERTKYAIGRLLEELKQDRVGLVVFAGDAYVQLPITADYVTAMSFVWQISPSMVSRQGTAIGAAIDLCVSGFSSDSEGARVIVLISDGENHEDDALAAAQRATEKGVAVYTIGIGTPEGAPIKIGDDFLRDETGEMVVTHLDETGLQRIALATGGAYIRSSDASVGLDEIVAKIREVEGQEFGVLVFEEYDEQFAWFAGAGLFCIVLGWAMLGRRNRLLARFNIFSRDGVK